MASAIPAIVTEELGRFPRGQGLPHVLAGVSFRLAPGRCLGILGGNGAGKSTLFRLLAGLAPIGCGRASLFGVPVPEPASRRGFGYLPEQPVVLEYLTGAEYLRLFGELEGLSGAGLERAIDEALEPLGLSPHRDTGLGRYSKGMVQKLELARIFLTPKRLLLLDEPMTGLDSEAQSFLLARLAAFKAGGGTLVVSAHETELVDALCDELAVLAKGRLVRQGETRGMLARKEWFVELEAEATLPAPLPEGASLAEGGRRLEFPDRDGAERALARLVQGRVRVAGFGPRTMKLHELLAGVGREAPRA